MMEKSDSDYSYLDRPEILMGIFHPRLEYGSIAGAANTIDVSIPVAGNIQVAGCFHMTEKSAPNILFFHGNGEIAGDYDELGPVYNRMDMNFLVVDYRGYGRSSGRPTVTSMMRDCHAEFDHFSPFSEAQALHDACPSPCKTLLRIPGANHNDIFMRGFDAYMKAVKALSQGMPP
jgi:alpha-beta hydrolase superfamily lysophospholipase